MNLEKELQNKFDLMEYGATMEIVRGEDGFTRARAVETYAQKAAAMESDLPTSIGAAGALGAEEVQRTMGLGREEQEAEMRAQVPGLKGAAAGATSATLTTIPDIFALGYGGVKALLAKEGERGQAFLDGLSKISSVAGSELAGKIYADYVGGLDATDEEKAAMMVGYEAGEWGGIPGLAGAASVVKKGLPKAVSAAGDVIVEAGKRSESQLAEGGQTLFAGAPIDDAVNKGFVAAGEAVKAMRGNDEQFLSLLEKDVRLEYPDVDLDIYGDSQKGYTLSKIIVPKEKRKQGIGEQVMGRIVATADQEGAVVKLTPSKDFGATSTARLKKFYKKFGFVENKGRYKDFSIKETMYRLPVAKEINASLKPPTEKEPGIIAFHGSGADFDEFKLEKIGTGEGAQAYGYGLYFAEKEDIAKYYKNMMQRNVDIDGKPYIRGNNINDDLVDPDIADDLGATNGDLEEAIKNSEEFLQEMVAEDNVDAIRSVSKEIEKLKKLRGRITVSDQEGKMYKVGLEPKPEDMLDYQIPIEQQPENIQQTVKKALSYIYPDVKDPALSMRGSDLQNAIINRIAVSRGNIEKMSDPIDADIARIDPNNEKTEAAIAAQIMLEQGIPGMKYRDAGSRGGSTSLKDASFNYVIFDDKMIKILEKYGIVGPVAITGVAASQQEGEDDGRSA